MNITQQTPITLPIAPSVVRCLAHGHLVGEWCERLDNCAAHQTIKHDKGLDVLTAYRKCAGENMVGYLPMEGFPVDDEDDGRAA